jgi:hypothetical protein
MQEERLKSLKESIGQPLQRVFPNAVIFNTELADIGEGVFAVLADSEAGNNEASTGIHAILWAASRGAAMRAWHSKIEADDLQLSIPPYYVLFNGARSYGELTHSLKKNEISFLESASYRIMVDGAFIHRKISTRGATYYFRALQEIADEAPYAVLHSNF